MQQKEFIQKIELEIHELRSALELKILKIMNAKHRLDIFEYFSVVLVSVTPREIVSSEEIDVKYFHQYKLRKQLEKFFLSQLSEHIEGDNQFENDPERAKLFRNENIKRAKIIENVADVKSCLAQNVIGNIF